MADEGAPLASPIRCQVAITGWDKPCILAYTWVPKQSRSRYWAFYGAKLLAFKQSLTTLNNSKQECTTTHQVSGVKYQLQVEKSLAYTWIPRQRGVLRSRYWASYVKRFTQSLTTLSKANKGGPLHVRYQVSSGNRRWRIMLAWFWV